MTAEAPLTAVIRAAARSTDRLLADRLHSLDLTAARLEILATLAENPGCTSADAARACDVTPQSAGIVIATLKDRGLLAVGESAGRAMPITVTDAGLGVLDAAWDATRPLERRLAMLLGAAGIRRMRGTAAALADMAAKPATTPAPVHTEDPRHARVGNAAGHASPTPA